ncbi:MAG: methylenetetrahydrofolate reductase [Steroidobacteraceae bacterium]
MNTNVVDFVRAASTEISTHDEDLLPALAGKLPTGMVMYVAHTPKASLDDVVRVAVKAQSVGFRASPHIVARRLPSEDALKDALRRLSDAGVEQALLIAGDLEPPIGKFTSTLQVLDTGLLETSAIKRIGVAGHPEGHQAIGAAALLAALRYKQAFGARTGIQVHIVTQFGFNPEAICAWDKRMTEQGIALPVHVGIAGPTPPHKLIKFALQCGVGASLHSFAKNLGAVANLARLATTADEMLLGLIRGRAEYSGSRLVQPHFYAFGGTMATATWLRAVADGSFTVQPDGRKFVVNA